MQSRCGQTALLAVLATLVAVLLVGCTAGTGGSSGTFYTLTPDIEFGGQFQTLSAYFRNETGGTISIGTDGGVLSGGTRFSIVRDGCENIFLLNNENCIVTIRLTAIGATSSTLTVRAAGFAPRALLY